MSWCSVRCVFRHSLSACRRDCFATQMSSLYHPGCGRAGILRVFSGACILTKVDKVVLYRTTSASRSVVAEHNTDALTSRIKQSAFMALIFRYVTSCRRLYSTPYTNSTLLLLHTWGSNNNHGLLYIRIKKSYAVLHVENITGINSIPSPNHVLEICDFERPN